MRSAGACDAVISRRIATPRIRAARTCATGTRLAGIRLYKDTRMDSVRSKRGIEEPRQPTHAIGAADDSLAGVADVRIRELVGGDRIVRGDVRRPDHPGDVHEFVALVEPQSLVALHDPIAVGLHLGHRHRATAGQTIALSARALAVEGIRAVQSGGV